MVGQIKLPAMLAHTNTGIRWLLMCGITHCGYSSVSGFNHIQEEIIGERAKRARCYLVMFIETRDIYIYIRTSVSSALVFCELNSRARKWNDFLA